MKKKDEPAWWDLTIYIPPEKIADMPSDCGDSYDVDNRDKGFCGLSHMLSMMKRYGKVYEDENAVAYGSPATMRTMKRILKKGVTIIVDREGGMRLVVGDGLIRKQYTEEEMKKLYGEECGG